MQPLSERADIVVLADFEWTDIVVAEDSEWVDIVVVEVAVHLMDIQ